MVIVKELPKNSLLSNEDIWTQRKNNPWRLTVKVDRKNLRRGKTPQNVKN